MSVNKSNIWLKGAIMELNTVKSVQPTAAFCGICGGILFKTTIPNYSDTVISEWFCTNCNEYPINITYIYGG
jgi:hypothetical protein